MPRNHVEEWLEACELHRDLADAVMSSTNGYPVHVEDALAILQEDPSPARLSSMGPDDVTTARARQAWRELDPISQVAAAKLSAYVDPLPTSRVCSLLGLDEMAWGTLELRLVDAGLLLGDRRRWFHELRRRVLWQSILSETMRTAAVEAATEEIRGQLALPEAGPDDVVDFARIAAENKTLRREEPSVDAATSATADEIAIAASALELVETSRGEKAINAETLLTYARDVYGLSGDAIGALDRLADRKLLHVVSNDQVSIVVPTWGSTDAMQVVVGRAASEFGRAPIVRLATAVFETVVRPKLGTFHTARYGVGAPHVSLAAEEIASMHRQPKDGVVHLGRYDPGLFFQSTLGTAPIYASVAYNSEDERDKAAARLSEPETEVWEEPFKVLDVVSLPTFSVPSLRFGLAVSWLRGRSKFSLHMPRGLEAEVPLEVQAEAEVRHGVRALVRELSSRDERNAYGLEVVSGYAYSCGGDGTTTVEVIGADWVREIPYTLDWDGWLTKPFARLRLAEALDLGPDQTIGTIQWRSGGIMQDPVTHEIVDLMKAAGTFNRRQRPVEIRFDEDELRRRLQDAFEQGESDGRALAAALPHMGLSVPEPTTTYVLLELDEPSPGWVPGAHAGLRTATLPSLTGDDRVIFKMTRGVDADWDNRAPNEDLMREVFDIDVTSAHSHSRGEALGGLAKLLGFGRGEVRFLYAGD